MSEVKSYNDSSAVSLAYAMGNGDTAADFAGETFNLLPFTQEGFSMSKEAKTSTAIKGNRRSSGSKNTKGSASGSATYEFGVSPFIMDMLSALMMDDWKEVEAGVPASGTYLHDNDIKKFMAVEKTVKSGPLETDPLYHERYYGVVANDSTIEFGDGELVTLAMNYMAMNADYAEAAAGVDGLGGSIATAKTAPADYEIADSSNNLQSVILRDDQGVEMEVVFTDLSLQIQNNAREQTGLGRQFAAGVGIGKVAATLSGEIYFVDQTMLNAHMENKRLSAEFTVATEDGAFTFYLPNLMVQSPANSAEGENQDYKTSLTLSAEEGEATVGANTFNCVVAVKYVPA